MQEYRELLYCIGCGQCLLVYPAYNVYGSKFSANGELGGRGVAYSRLRGDIGNDKALDWCLTCGKCYQSCPVSINVPAISASYAQMSGKPGLHYRIFKFACEVAW